MTGADPALRIAELEARIAGQDKVIADLNEMVIAQWKKIDSLERRLGELRDEFDAASRRRRIIEAGGNYFIPSLQRALRSVFLQFLQAASEIPASPG